MDIAVIGFVVMILACFALIGLYFENRRQTDVLTRIAKAIEKRAPDE